MPTLFAQDTIGLADFSRTGRNSNRNVQASPSKTYRVRASTELEIGSLNTERD